MKLKYLCSLVPLSLILFAMLSCEDDDDKRVCDTFTPADSACFCKGRADDPLCNIKTPITLSLYTKEKVTLTPHVNNGTLWCRGFVIGHDIYLIDRESGSPHPFWKFDVLGDDPWEAKANFPGVKYGLTGSANGRGYASSYASKEFWEYNPVSNEWTQLTDMPFSTGETHWVEYNGKFYVPDQDGIYEFNALTKDWQKVSNQSSTGLGAVFLIGDDMYWYNLNDTQMKQFNLANKTSFQLHNLPEGFGNTVSFHSPFVLDDRAFVITRNSLWVFDKDLRKWSLQENAIEGGAANPDDVFVIDGKPYIVENGAVKLLEGLSE